MLKTTDASIGECPAEASGGAASVRRDRDDELLADPSAAPLRKESRR